MALTIDPAVAASFRGSHNLGIFFRLGTDPALHLWFGVNDVPIGIPSLDPEGTVYLGGGRFIAVPELEVLINGQAGRVEFTLSSAVPEFASFLLDLDTDAPPVQGAPVHVGIAALDDRWQPKTPAIPLWRGEADYWSVRQDPVPDAASMPMRTLALSVGTGNTARKRPRRIAWTHAMQQSISATDRFCDRVSRYTRQYVVTWPRF